MVKVQIRIPHLIYFKIRYCSFFRKVLTMLKTKFWHVFLIESLSSVDTTRLTCVFVMNVVFFVTYLLYMRSKMHNVRPSRKHYLFPLNTFTTTTRWQIQLPCILTLWLTPKKAKSSYWLCLFFNCLIKRQLIRHFIGHLIRHFQTIKLP